MGLPAFPASLTRRAILVAPGVAVQLCILFFVVHGWPLQVFIIGLYASGGTAVFMFHLRQERGDRNTLIPSLIAAAGVLVEVILTSTRTPQPLIQAGCVGLAVGAIAWAVRLLALLASRRRATAASVVRSAKD